MPKFLGTGFFVPAMSNNQATKSTPQKRPRSDNAPKQPPAKKQKVGVESVAADIQEAKLELKEYKQRLLAKLNERVKKEQGDLLVQHLFIIVSHLPPNAKKVGK